MLKMQILGVKGTFFRKKVLFVLKLCVSLCWQYLNVALRNRLLLTLKTRIYATKEDI